MKETKKVFRSRISILIIGFILATYIWTCIPIFQHKEYTGLFVLGPTLVFIIIILAGVHYEILGDKLYIKIWFIPNGSANIKDIVSVKRSYNLLSSPASSLKRLHIGFVNKKIGWLISPVREQEFFAALQSVNPNIKVDIPGKKGKWRIWDWDI